MPSSPIDKSNAFWEILKDRSTRYTATVTMAIEYITLQLLPTAMIPDMIIAGMPIYHIQKEGHGASDETLKYRSMGTIFLAHQKGGKRTFKCTLKINGPVRLMVLSFLQYLQKKGVQDDFSLKNFAERINVDLLAEVVEEPFVPPGLNSKIKYIQDYNDLGQETIAYHKTFPIITDTKIYTNMYLETLRYTEGVKLGVDTLEIDCAFREFIAPMHIRWYKNPKPEEKGYFSTWITDDERDALRRIDLFFNLFWGMRTIAKDLGSPQLEQKQADQYFMDIAVLGTGALLSGLSLWT